MIVDFSRDDMQIIAKKCRALDWQHCLVGTQSNGAFGFLLTWGLSVEK